MPAGFCFYKGSVFFRDLSCQADKTTLIKFVFYDLVYIKKKIQNPGPLR